MKQQLPAFAGKEQLDAGKEQLDAGKEQLDAGKEQSEIFAREGGGLHF